MISKSSSTYLLACGGTGGHLTPGIATAQELMRRGKTVILAISEKKIDQALLAAYPQMRFVTVAGKPFNLRPFGFFRALYAHLKGFFFSLSFIRRYRPAVVVGFGGFGMIPFILAAKCLGQTVVLHEANRLPGKATRLLGRWVKGVCLPEGVCVPGVKEEALHTVGVPLRDELIRHETAVAREALKLPKVGKILLVFGGSQGARPLNHWAYEHMDVLAEAGIHLVCVTGSGEPAKVLRRYTSEGRPVEMHFMPFCDQMSYLLSAVDVVVARSGAGSLAEIVRMRLPAIVVPFPQAADDHQTLNALYYLEKNAVKLMKQSEIHHLWSEVKILIHDDEACQRMVMALGSMEPGSAQKQFVDILMQCEGSGNSE